MLKLVFVLPLAMLSACATIVTGTSQTMTVSTDPAGATCTLDRGGIRVGAVPQTPGSVRVGKSGKDIAVTCAKEGYQTATVQQSSSFNGATFGNILVGGVIGVVVDASSGANFTYPGDVRLALAPNPAPLLPPLASLQPDAPDVAPVTPVSARSARPLNRTAARYSY